LVNYDSLEQAPGPPAKRGHARIRPDVDGPRRGR
jgi:hypothetical protein